MNCRINLYKDPVELQYLTIIFKIQADSKDSFSFYDYFSVFMIIFLFLWPFFCLYGHFSVSMTIFPFCMTIFLFLWPFFRFVWPFFCFYDHFSVLYDHFLYDHFSVSMTIFPFCMTIFLFLWPFFRFVWPFFCFYDHFSVLYDHFSVSMIIFKQQMTLICFPSTRNLYSLKVLQAKACNRWKEKMAIKTSRNSIARKFLFWHVFIF